MDKTNQFSILFDALAELAEEEEGQASPAQIAPNLPTLRAALDDLAPLPDDALFLGVADDGLPILLNLYDPVPGAILIAGDTGSGKTKFLQMIARGAEILHQPSQAQYAVLTPRPDEWNSPQDSQHNIGIFDAGAESAQELLSSLAEWAHVNKGETQCFLLLIDDLEALTKLDEQARQNLRWLLLRGASRRVWIFATLNASRARALGAWLDFFRTRLFGFIESREDAESIAGDADKAFNILSKGAEFTMPEEKGWVNFWILK